MINTKKFLISLLVSGAILTVPSVALAALTVGSTSIATDSTLNLQGGNIGVGDSTPDQLLEVLSATATDAQISVTNTSTGDALLGFQLVDGTNLFTMGVDNSDSDKFKISVGPLSDDFDIFVIDENGYIGLGADTPLHPIHILGDTYLDSGVGINTSMALTFRHYRVSTSREWSMGPATGGGTTAFSFNNVTDGVSDILAFSTAGKVGIGTSAPGDQLHIHDGVGDENYIRITNSASAVTGFYLGAEQTGAVLWNSEDGNMIFGTDNTTQMTLNTTGDLSIVGDTINVATSKTPVSAGAACTQGDIVWDASFIYVCTVSGAWKRAAIATW